MAFIVTFRLIDSHAHTQFAAYDQDREAVIQRALDAGVGIINIGTQYSTSEGAVRRAERYPDGVWATVGFHPNHADLDSHHDPWELREKRQEAFDISKFRNIAEHPKVVAIGECGLDYAHFVRKRSARLQNGASADLSAKALATAEALGEGGLPQEEIERAKQKQRDVFVQQLELAYEVRKPLVIHCRNAFADLIKILASCFVLHDSRPKGVVHFFSGSWEDAKKLLDLGFYFSFGGVITFARDYDEVVKKAPLDRLLVETDAPYVSPVPYRGQRNEPAYIIETVKKIAELRGIPYDEVAGLTTESAKRLFRL